MYKQSIYTYNKYTCTNIQYTCTINIHVQSFNVCGRDIHLQRFHANARLTTNIHVQTFNVHSCTYTLPTECTYGGGGEFFSKIEQCFESAEEHSNGNPQGFRLPSVGTRRNFFPKANYNTTTLTRIFNPAYGRMSSRTFSFFLSDFISWVAKPQRNHWATLLIVVCDRAFHKSL